MKYTHQGLLTLLFIFSAPLWAMNDDSNQEDPSSAIIKHDLGDYVAESAAFSDDGKRMVVASRDMHELYSLDTDEEKPTKIKKRTFPNHILDVKMIPHTYQIITKFSDTNDTVISHDTEMVSQRIPCGHWDKYNSRGDYLRKSDKGVVVHCHADNTDLELANEEGFNGDSNLDENGHVVARSDDRVQLWDYKNRIKIFDREFQRRVRTIRLSPEGDKLFVAFYSDDSRGHGEVWDTKTSEKLYDLPYISSVRFIDGKLLGTRDLYDVTVIDAYTGRALRSRPSSMMRMDSCVFSPNNKYFAQLGWSTVFVYDADGKLLASVPSQGEVDKINAISPDGDNLVVTTRRNKTSLWNLAHLIHKKSKCWCGTTCYS